MNFPSFGDAPEYERLGRACADALRGAGGRVFDACYHPIRPRGIAFLMAVPYLVTADPVAANYVMLALNVAFLALATVALGTALAADPGLLPGRKGLLLAFSFVALLANMVSHLPVRLGDLPSLAVFLIAIGVGMRCALQPLPDRRLVLRYAAAGGLCAAATLLKITYFALAPLFLAVWLLLDRNLRTDRRRLACAGAFLAGFSPVALRFVDVFLHTGHLALFDAAAMRPFYRPERGLAIEAVFHTIPEEGAYTVRPAAPLGFASLVVLRLYRGLFGFEWAVYQGPAWHGPVWELTAWDLIRAWILVLLWAGLTAAVIWRAPRGLGLLAATAGLVGLATAVLGHTELRYYALPRTVWWLALACGGMWMLRLRRTASRSLT